MTMIDRQCWCGSSEARLLFHVNMDDGTRLPWVRCDGCGVEGYHPQPGGEILRRAYGGAYYGRAGRKFIGPLAGLVAWFQGGRARLVARTVGGGRLLDVGCGNGGFLRQAAAKGFTVEGTEWTAESAARAGGDFPVHVGDLLDLDLEQGAYQGVSLWHVFEHLRDPSATLERIHGLLGRGGWLFLSMPNHGSWQARRFGRDWFHLDPPRHLHGFDPASLRRLLEARGFELVRWHTWSLEQNPFGWIQSLLNSRGFSRDRAYGVMKGVGGGGVAEKAGDLLCVAALALPALVYTTAAGLSARGATMTIVARKRPQGRTP